MSLKYTIRKKITEHKENKINMIQESKTIKNRFNFILENTNFFSEQSKRKTYLKLQNERSNLLNMGYNPVFVKESFLDVMNSLFGGEDNKVYFDTKTNLMNHLSAKFAKDEIEKQVILSAFANIPEEMVVKAIDNNDIEELSNQIAKIAVSKFKEKLGIEGKTGTVFSTLADSINLEQFKKVLSDLLREPIKQIKQKMDNKLETIKQNIVSTQESGGSSMLS